MESLQSFENPAQPGPEAAVISSPGVTEGYAYFFLIIQMSEGMKFQRASTRGSCFRCDEMWPARPLGNGWNSRLRRMEVEFLLITPT